MSTFILGILGSTFKDYARYLDPKGIYLEVLDENNQLIYKNFPYCMYSFGRKYPLLPFIGRFKRERIDKGVYKFHRTLPGIVLRVEMPDEKYKKVRSLLNQFILKEDILKYNYLGLVYGLFNMVIHLEGRFTCSEFVYYVLNQSGVVELEVPRNLVRPQTLLDIESRVVYKGDLKRYKPCNNYGKTSKTKTNKMSAAYGQA